MWVWPTIAETIKSPIVPIMHNLQCNINDLKNMKYKSKNVAHMFYGTGLHDIKKVVIYMKPNERSGART